MSDGAGGSSDVAFIDANIVVRYFMQDQPEVVDTVQQIIERHPQLLITEGTIAEIGYVLTRRYGVARHDVVDALISLLQRRNVSVFQLDGGLVIQALLLCRPSGRVSFADAMLWASARQSGIGVAVYSLDRRLPSVGLTILSDPPEDTTSG